MKQFFLMVLGVSFITILNAQKESSGETFQFDVKQLAITKIKVQSGDKSVTAAYKKLIANANKMLAYKPVSVLDKVDMPPSGNKHDYVSLAPYWWPNPNTPNGLSYIKKEKVWTGTEITPYYVEEAFNLLLHASEKYDCTSCKVSLQNFAGTNYSDLLLQLF